jgi:hypothetical protein
MLGYFKLEKVCCKPDRLYYPTPGFDISAVDRIHLYVYSDVEKSMTFWIDDLTVDTSLALEKTIYKGRVPVDETVVAYFYVRIEDK